MQYLLSVIVLVVVQEEETAEWLPPVGLPLVEAAWTAVCMHVNLDTWVGDLFVS